MIKQLLKIAVVASTAGLMMGNQSCQQAAVQKRTLKKIIEMGAVRSPSIGLPNGASFDFAFVASSQMASVASASNKFALRTSAPIIADPSTDNKYFNVTTSDAKMVQKAFAAAGKSTDPGAVFSREAWCLVNLPQAKISTTILSFEAMSGVGLGIGFSPTGPITGVGLSASLNVESSQLSLTMRADPPLLGNISTNYYSTIVNSNQTKTNGKFSIDFAMFSLGPSYYYTTPLADVTKNALTLGLDQLATEMTDEWYTRVMADNDVEMILVGGRDVGLEVGDELKVYNENMGWVGEPCNSTYVGNTGTGEDSLYGTIVITSVGDNLSNAKVVSINPNSVMTKAQTGAKVRLSRLHEDIEAAAAKPATPSAPVDSQTLAQNKAARSK